MTHVNSFDRRTFLKSAGALAAGTAVAGCAAAGVAGTVAQALATKRQLRITYFSASSDSVTQREVAPASLFHQAGATYLQAEYNGEMRTFRLDRIQSAQLLDAPSATSHPIAVDLGSGSGAIAITIAHAVPSATVYAVERSAEARRYLERNVAALAPSIRIVPGDMTDPALLRELDGAVDVVAANPPYVPETPDLDAEVYADPHEAVFSGADGMDAIRGLVPVAARLLCPGGRLGIEHDDATSRDVQAVVRGSGAFGAPRVMQDLAGRARFVTASKLSA